MAILKDFSGYGNWICETCNPKAKLGVLTLTRKDAHSLKFCPWCGEPIERFNDSDIGFYLTKKETENEDNN